MSPINIKYVMLEIFSIYFEFIHIGCSQTMWKTQLPGLQGSIHSPLSLKLLK